MGAAQFGNLGIGKDAKDAFSKLVQSARYEHGHGGYSGTIAEKHSFELITPPSGIAALDFARWALDSDPYGSSGLAQGVPPEHGAAVLRAAKFADNKYGPAVAVEIKGDELAALRAKRPSQFPEGSRVFYFFGWASE
jgi:hypothetical protein